MSTGRFVFVTVFAVPLALIASCSVDELDLTGKRCPCVSGFVCDLPSNTCRATADGGLADDALVAPERNPAARLNVTALTAAWAAPNVVRWDFTVEGSAADFKSYVVEVGPSAAAFETNKVEIYGGLERPELGAFDARSGKPAGPTSVFTLTRANANTKQYARVTVTDKADQSNVSAVTPTVVPAVGPSREKIFDGVTAAANPRPVGEFDFKSGSHALVVECGGGPSPCVKKVELVDLGLALDAQGFFSQADFDAAYLDLDLQGNVGGSSFDSTVAIEPGVGGCAGAECRWGLTGWTQSNAPEPGNMSLQVPLKKLVSGVRGPLTRAILEEKGFKVAALAFSGTWKDGATLRLRGAHIRW
jgi:hypothetical protein